MKQVILLMALLFGWLVGARADAFGPFAARGGISTNGKYVARLPDKYLPDVPPEVSIHAYDEENAEYRLLRKIKFDRADTPNFIFISDDGARLAFVNISSIHTGRNALVIYGEKGRLKSWDLSELISEGERAKCLHTGSTVQWFEVGEFIRDTHEFQLFGPSYGTQGWVGRMDGHRNSPAIGYRITIDTMTLSLYKKPLPPTDLTPR